MSGFESTLEAWAPFFAAQLAAVAALLGLLFVALSLNLSQILADPALPKRAEIALILLVLQFVIASVALMPDETARSLGQQILAAGAVAWVWTLLLSRGLFRTMTGKLRRVAWLSVLLLQVALAPCLAGGAMLLAGSPRALDVLALGLLLAVGKATLDSWVLLVEINR